MPFVLGEADGFPAHSIGMGVGLRPPHYSHVLANPTSVDWFEVITENFLGLRGQGFGRPLEVLERVRRDYPVVLHGVSLSVGSTDPLDENYLRHWKALIERVEPAWVSDHLCWTGVEGQNLHDLLPLPYTEEALGHVVERVRRVQDFLGRRILLENVSSYLTFSHSSLTEWHFLRELVARADCGLLLDLNNIYVSSRNHGFDPQEFLEAVPWDRVGQLHLAGYSDHGSHLIDTHDHPVSDAVWALYRQVCAHHPEIPTLVEWDDRLPEFPRLEAELERAREQKEAARARHPRAASGAAVLAP